jgi:hypothetical protein
LLVHSNVQGLITLNVKRAPLESVLSIVAEQTESRWNAVYPLYSANYRLERLKKKLVGEAPRDDGLWTNLTSRGPGFGFRGGGPGGDFGENLRGQRNPVSLTLENKDLGLATMALARFGPIQIVPEDGASANVRLRLQQADIEEAVAALAKQAKRSWTTLYTLQGGPRFGRGGPGRGDGTNEFRGPPGGFRFGEEPSDEEREARRQRVEALMETLSPEERQRMEEERKRREEFANLSPEERRQRFEQRMNSGEMQQRVTTRMMSSIKNTTPEQRAERDRQMREMRQRREREGGGPGGRREGGPRPNP